MEYTLFVVLAPFTLGILLVTGFLIRQNGKGPEAKALLTYFLFVSAYLLNNLIELLLPTPAATLTAVKAEHLFFSFLPVIWFHFALLYTGVSRKVSLSIVLTLAFFSVATNILIQTNHLHHLVWQRFNYFPVRGYLTMRADYGPWMWLYGVFMYALYIIGSFVILKSALSGNKMYRYQALVIVTGALVPLIFNLFYVFHLIPFLRKDFTPISFSITALSGYIGITKFRLFKIIPVAREKIIQGLDTGILLFDSGSSLIDYNKKAASLFNLDSNTIGQHFTEQKDLTPLTPLLTGETDTIPITIEGDKGKSTFSARLSHMESNDSSVMTVTLVDITKETRLLHEKEALANQLIEKNQELENAQDTIIQQEKLAVIGQLTAGIAHEINNPLSFAKNNYHIFRHYFQKLLSSFPQKTRESEALIEQLNLILGDSEEGTNRAIAIVHDLLKFSRPVRGEQRQLLNINKAVETCLIMVGSELRYVSEVVEAYDQNLPGIECRESEIDQVIINILTNALHATRKKSQLSMADYKPCIKIETWSDNTSVFCAISDNGEEIRSQDLPHLFEPFFTTKKRGEGTGLGLSIAREIIEGRYSGSIWVDITTTEEECKSKRFIFSLPIKNKNRKISRDIHENSNNFGRTTII